MLKQLAFLEGREDRKSFFRRVHRFAPPGSPDAVLIEKGYDEAKEAFRKTFRKSGERSFEHCRGVAIILMDVVGVTDAATLVAALLHDVIEDCRKALGWNKDLVEQKFNATVAFLVDALTMPDGEFPNRDARIAAYHVQVLKAALCDIRVLMIKLADRLHNLVTCDALTRENQLRMVVETEKLYLPYAKQYNILYKELSQVLRFRRKTFRRLQESTS